MSTLAMPLGHGADVVLRAVEALQAGPVWVEDLKVLSGSPERDNAAGYLITDLRRCGYLVQVEGGIAEILPDAPCTRGYWQRHDELGLVRVEWERPGFPLVRVRRLHHEDTIKVERSKLKGK